MPTIYERGNVRVDEHFARFGSKAFAINKINSVEVRVEHTPASSAWMGVALIGAIAGLIACAVGQPRSVILGFLIWAVAAGIAYVMFRGAVPSDLYKLYLMTSSTEAQAYMTDEKDDIRALRDAIEKAVSAAS